VTIAKHDRWIPIAESRASTKSIIPGTLVRSRALVKRTKRPPRSTTIIFVVVPVRECRLPFERAPSVTFPECFAQYTAARYSSLVAPPCTVIATATTVNEQHWLVYFRPLSPPEIRRIGTIANRATRRTLPYPRNDRVKKNRRRRHSPSALTIVNAYQRLFVPIS